MFTFADNVPANIRLFLIPLLQAWIDRRDNSVYAVDTARFGLVRFRRTPWPYADLPATLVEADSEQDAATLATFAATF